MNKEKVEMGITDRAAYLLAQKGKKHYYRVKAACHALRHLARAWREPQSIGPFYFPFAPNEGVILRMAAPLLMYLPSSRIEITW